MRTTRFEEEKQKRELETLHREEEEESTQILSAKYGIPYLDLGTIPVNTEALKILSESESRRGEMAVIQKVGKNLQVAVKNPDKPETKSFAQKLKDETYNLNLFLVSRRGLEKAWNFYKEISDSRPALGGSIQISPNLLEELTSEVKTLGEIQKKLKVMTSRTTQLLEMIIAGALSLEASDVHLEAQEKDVRLRFRLDGILQDVAMTDGTSYKLLLSRIKLISDLKLNIHDRAQDGRFTIRLGQEDIEVRVSTLPGPYGENTVLRILNPRSISVRFEDLGMQPWVVKTMARELEKPNGMILTTGPTGSGKTTTLYAFLKKIHKPGVKIITLEDPIEYHLTGVEQTQVEKEKGYDFAQGLKSVLRQDPDVILVGEIRDPETAETAIHAALTGHLVFSTLHTNNAAGTIPRLLDMGIKPGLIAPAVNVAMAQRLLRKLCEKCKKESPASAEELEEIEEELKNWPKEVKKPSLKNLKIFKAAGCEKCNGTGYQGRIGVFEIILRDDEMERVISQEATESQIKEAALHQGQITLKQDAILKVMAGITDMQEVKRVVG